MVWLDEYMAQQARAPLPATPTGESLPSRSFLGALRAASSRPAVIAEIKFQSPSKGVIRPTHDVEAVASGYAKAGAAALSVLVDGPKFGGDPSYLTRAKQACGLPILAKGFFVRPDLVPILGAYGADALLLIARGLSRVQLEAMLAAAQAAKLDALVEVHTEDDLDRIQGLDLPLVGVNHRDLDTLRLDPQRTATLGDRLPPRALRVAESGLKTRQDLDRMMARGYAAVLVGSALMAEAHPGQALQRLMAVESPC